MDYNELITSIFQIVIIPFLGILVGAFVKWINLKKEEYMAGEHNALVVKYYEMAIDTIQQAVLCANQTYVDALKKEGTFDKQAQEKAFQMVYNHVILMLGKEGQKYLEELVGDVGAFLTVEIEAEVNKAKIQTTE